MLLQKFACNGTVIEHPEYGEVIQLQGDQRKNICQFLLEVSDLEPEFRRGVERQRATRAAAGKSSGPLTCRRGVLCVALRMGTRGCRAWGAAARAAGGGSRDGTRGPLERFC